VSPLELTANSQTINIDGIGAVCFNRSRRARRIIISVSATKGVMVSVPWRTALQKAIEFVNIKKEMDPKTPGINRAKRAAETGAGTAYSNHRYRGGKETIDRPLKLSDGNAWLYL